MKIKVFVLLGGLFGPDGWIVSRGMVNLASQIRSLGFDCECYAWSNYDSVSREIASIPADMKVVLIGFSGGGSRATWIASLVHQVRVIDLMILYDPSPASSMSALRGNVKAAINFHNNNPMFFGLGGGVLVGAQVKTIEISENHLAVQFDSKLHNITLAAIESLR